MGKYKDVTTTSGGHIRVRIETKERRFIYVRVSSARQKTGLEKQIRLLEEKYKGYEVISDIASAFNEKDLKPYWNQRCEENQLQLWLPHKTVSQEVDLSLSNGLLNYTEEKLSHWKRVLIPTSLIPTLMIREDGSFRFNNI